MGVDPGTNILGYACIKIQGSSITVLELNVLDMRKLENQALKLKYIFENLIKVIDLYQPDSLAFEEPFFGKNVQSMLKLGRAQGVAMAAALSREIPVMEYSPRKIKQSICGNGNASKEQVSAMLSKILSFKSESNFMDATDGLAVALCHYFQQNAVYQKSEPTKIAKSKKTSWNAFLSTNPGREIK